MSRANVFTRRGGDILLLLGEEQGKIRGFNRGSNLDNPVDLVRALEPWVVSDDKLVVHDALGRWDREGSTIGGLIYAEALSGSMAATLTRNAENKAGVLSAFNSSSLAELGDRQRRGVARYLSALDKQNYAGYREGLAEWKTMSEASRSVARRQFIADLGSAGLDPQSSWWLPSDFVDVYLAEVGRRADALDSAGIRIPSASRSESRSSAWMEESVVQKNLLGLYFEYKAASEMLSSDPDVGLGFLSDVVRRYRLSMEESYASREHDVVRLFRFLGSSIVDGSGAWYMSAMKSVDSLSDRLELLRSKAAASRDRDVSLDMERKRALFQWEIGSIVVASIVGKEDAETLLACSGSDCQRRETVLLLAWHNYLEGFLDEGLNAEISAKIDEIERLDAEELRRRISESYVGQRYAEKDSIVLDLVSVLEDLDALGRDPELSPENALGKLDKLRKTFHGTGQEKMLEEARASLEERDVDEAERFVSFILHLYSVTLYLAESGDAQQRRVPDSQDPILDYIRAKNEIQSVLSEHPGEVRDAPRRAEKLVEPSETGGVPLAGVSSTDGSGVLVGGLRYPGFSHFMVVASLSSPDKGVFEDVVYPLVIGKKVLGAKEYDALFWDMARQRKTFRGPLEALTERGIWKTGLGDNGLEEAARNPAGMGEYLVLNDAFADRAALESLSGYLGKLRGLHLKRAAQKIYGSVLAHMRVSTLGAYLAERDIDVVFSNPGGDRFLGTNARGDAGQNVLGKLLRIMLVRIGAERHMLDTGSALYGMMLDYPETQEEVLVTTGHIYLAGRTIVAVSSDALASLSERELSRSTTALAFLHGSRLRDSALGGDTLLALDRSMSYSQIHLGYTLFFPYTYQRLFSSPSGTGISSRTTTAVLSDSIMRMAGIKLERGAAELLDEIRTRYADWAIGVAYRGEWKNRDGDGDGDAESCEQRDELLVGSVMSALTESHISSHLRDFFLARISGVAALWEGSEIQQSRAIGAGLDSLRRGMSVFGFSTPLSGRAAVAISRMFGLNVLGDDRSLPEDTSFQEEWALVDEEALPGERLYGARAARGWASVPKSWRDRRLMSRKAAVVFAEMLMEYMVVAETIASATDASADSASRDIPTQVLVGFLNVVSGRNT